MSLIYENKTCNYSLQDGFLFIFQMEFYSPEKNTIRKIRNTKSGNLITISDNISCYLDKVKFTVFDVNNPTNVINLKKNFNNEISYNNVLTNDKIIITLSRLDECLICNYKIL